MPVCFLEFLSYLTGWAVASPFNYKIVLNMWLVSWNWWKSISNKQSGEYWLSNSHPEVEYHYSDAIMSATASSINGIPIVYKHQSSASLAFVRGIHHRLVDSPHKVPVKRKLFPFVDTIMISESLFTCKHTAYFALVGYGMRVVNTLRTIARTGPHPIWNTFIKSGAQCFRLIKGKKPLPEYGVRIIIHCEQLDVMH